MSLPAKTTVLIVEDERFVRQTIRVFLEDAGFQVLEAEDGQQGLRAVLASHPDVILIDLRMPVMDGITMLAKLQEHAPDTPTIIASGTGTITDAVDALRLGAWDYLIKPIEDMGILLHVIHRVLERANLLKQQQEYQRRLEDEIRERTADLEQANEQLRREMEERERADAELRRSEDLLKTFIESTQEAIISIDSSGLVTMFNSAAGSMFGWSSDEMLGNPLDRLMPDQYRHKHHEHVQNYFTRGKPDAAIGNIVELPALRRDGTVFPMEISLSAGHLADERFVIAVARDVTDRKRAEREREDLIKELAAKNSELELFAHTVSHDLKSPLHTIMGFARRMANDLASQQSGRATDDLKCINRACDRMLALMEGLLALGKAGKPATTAEEVSMQQIVQEAIELLAGPIEATGASVIIPNSLPIVSGDPVRLREVWQNLIDNALKHAESNQQTLIKVGMRVEANQEVFYVEDNGPGIDPAIQKDLFDVFTRSNKRREGSGIGLAIVKRIIDAHGGKVWIESAGEGDGTTFCFTVGALVQPAEAQRTAHAYHETEPATQEEQLQGLEQR